MGSKASLHPRGVQPLNLVFHHQEFPAGWCWRRELLICFLYQYMVWFKFHETLNTERANGAFGSILLHSELCWLCITALFVVSPLRQAGLTSPTPQCVATQDRCWTSTGVPIMTRSSPVAPRTAPSWWVYLLCLAGWGLLHAKNAAAKDTCVSEDISCPDAKGRVLAGTMVPWHHARFILLYEMMLSGLQGLAKNWSRNSRMSFITCGTAEFGLSQLVLSCRVTVWEGAASDFQEESLQHWDGLGPCLPGFVFNCFLFFLALGICLMFGKRKEKRASQCWEVFWFCSRWRWFLTPDILMDAVGRGGDWRGTSPSGFRIDSPLDLRVRLKFIHILAGCK